MSRSALVVTLAVVAAALVECSPVEPRVLEDAAAGDGTAPSVDVDTAVPELQLKSTGLPEVEEGKVNLKIHEGSPVSVDLGGEEPVLSSKTIETEPVAPEENTSATKPNEEPSDKSSFPLVIDDEIGEPVLGLELLPNQEEDTAQETPEETSLVDDYDPILASENDFLLPPEEIGDEVSIRPEEAPFELVSDDDIVDEAPTLSEIAEILNNADPNNNLISDSDPAQDSPIENIVEGDILNDESEPLVMFIEESTADVIPSDTLNNGVILSEKQPIDPSVGVEQYPASSDGYSPMNEPVIVVGVSKDERPEPVAAPPVDDEYYDEMPDYLNLEPDTMFYTTNGNEPQPMPENPMTGNVPDYNYGVVPADKLVAPEANEEEIIYPSFASEKVPQISPIGFEDEGMKTNNSTETPSIFIIKLIVRRPELPSRRPYLRNPITSHLYNFVGKVLDKIAASKSIPRPIPPPEYFRTRQNFYPKEYEHQYEPEYSMKYSRNMLLAPKLGYPMGQQPDYPMGPHPDHPMGPELDYPMGPQLDYPMGPHPDHPMGPQPDYPMESQPDYPMGPQPDYPIEAPADFPVISTRTFPRFVREVRRNSPLARLNAFSNNMGFRDRLDVGSRGPPYPYGYNGPYY